MGAPRKYTAAQRLEAESRLFMGEPIKEVAKSIGVGVTTLRQWTEGRTSTIKAMAEQLVAVEKKVRSLNPALERRVRNTADEMLYISQCLSRAGAHGADIAERLNRRAAKKADYVDVDNDHQSEQALRQVALLIKTAEAAASIPMNLIRANKETTDRMLQIEMDSSKEQGPSDLSDEELKLRARDYGLDI